jgi:DNA-binding beta-propeller fold protein YncE
MTRLYSTLLAAGLALLSACAPGRPRINYADYVWPPPPDQPRIRLDDIIWGRADVQAKSGLQRALLGAPPQNPYEWFKRPFGVAFDAKGRILVTDSGLGCLFRFDRAAHRADVLGTKGAVALRTPLGLGLGPDGTIYVADIGLKKVVALDGEGKLCALYGKEVELQNPSDAAVSADGSQLYVADSKAHRIVVYDLKSGNLVRTFGKRGTGEGEFAFPTAIAVTKEGTLLVVDQINARVQALAEDGSFLQTFGELGVGFGNFVRPKDVAVDEAGLIYVTDAAFSNLQIFNEDHDLLTFVGSGGPNPGQFQGASGVAAAGDRFAVVDQLGNRVQVFRFIGPKTTE